MNANNHTPTTQNAKSKRDFKFKLNELICFEHKGHTVPGRILRRWFSFDTHTPVYAIIDKDRSVFLPMSEDVISSFRPC